MKIRQNILLNVSNFVKTVNVRKYKVHAMEAR